MGKVIRDFMDSDKRFALDNCKTLYRDLRKSCMETCMCWGWEFGPGWNSAIKDLSVCLEALNIELGPKFGIKVIMDQCKEKFGLFHGYYHIEIESPLVYSMWHKPFEFLYGLLKEKVDFAMKIVTDKAGFYEDDAEEIPSDELESYRKRYDGCNDVRFEERDGKWYKIIKIYHCPTNHMEPTRHRILYKVMNALRRISVALDFRKEPSTRQLVMSEYADHIASELVRKATDRCYNTCEECGTSIGNEYSPRVETKGWITYVCDRCDIRKNIRYKVDSVEYAVKNSGLVLNSDEQSVVDTAKRIIEDEEYFETEEMKDCLEKIEKIGV